MAFSELELIRTYPFRDKGPILVDVGAHHGSFTCSFAEKGWRVIAFEPEESNRSAFERNLARYNQVTCLPKAVSDTSGQKVPFYVSDEHYGIHSLKPFHASHKLAYEVETVRLDEILRALQVSGVTLLKIDIEGADFLALRGFDFEQYQPEIIIVEFMDDRSERNFGYTHHDVAAYMKKKGYAAFVSEWAPIKEYGREGVLSEPHVWIQCVPYPLDHKPAWGNLIFVAENDKDAFRKHLHQYLKNLRRRSMAERMKTDVAKLLGRFFLFSSGVI
jgi:FkbM family methyltransferase